MNYEDKAKKILNIPYPDRRTIESRCNDTQSYMTGHRDARHEAYDIAVYMEGKISELKAENAKLKSDRDLWKLSESQCNENYNELLAENERLRGALKLIKHNHKQIDNVCDMAGVHRFTNMIEAVDQALKEKS